MMKKVNDFLAINLRKYFKSIREKQNFRKIAKSLYIFLTTPDEVDMCNQILLMIAYIAMTLRL